MLICVGFSKQEREILSKIGEELEVLPRCSFVAKLEDLLEILSRSIDSNATRTPAVIFLDLDKPDWRDVLAAIKEHPLYCNVPVVCGGRLKSQAEIDDLYELRANSYIEKSATFEDMLKVASVSLRFWLQFSQLPGRHLPSS